MQDNYYRDLKGISLSQYEKELEKAELLPSRRIIREDIRKRFATLKDLGIENLNDLMSALKTPVKIQSIAKQTGLSEEYFIILKREIASYNPKPVKLKDFLSISADTVRKLEKINIFDTKQLFGYVATERDRKDLSLKTDISYEDILELTKLADVSRIQWVGANFARLLVDSGCDTVQKITMADYKNLYEKLVKTYKEKQYFKGKFGLNDIKLCVEAAKRVPDAVQY